MNSGKIVAGREGTGKLKVLQEVLADLKKASWVKGFLVQFFYTQTFCRKTLADLRLVHSYIIFLCCLDGPSDNDKDHVVGLLTNLPPPPHPC